MLAKLRSIRRRLLRVKHANFIQLRRVSLFLLWISIACTFEPPYFFCWDLRGSIIWLRWTCDFWCYFVGLTIFLISLWVSSFRWKNSTCTRCDILWTVLLLHHFLHFFLRNHSLQIWRGWLLTIVNLSILWWDDLLCSIYKVGMPWSLYIFSYLFGRRRNMTCVLWWDSIHNRSLIALTTCWLVLGVVRVVWVGRCLSSFPILLISLT